MPGRFTPSLKILKAVAWLLIVAILFGLIVYALFRVRDYPFGRGHRRMGPDEIFFFEVFCLFLAALFGFGLYDAIKRFLRLLRNET